MLLGYNVYLNKIVYGTYDSNSKAASLSNKNKMRLCLLFEVKFIRKFMHINIFPEWPLTYYFFVIIKIVIFFNYYNLVFEKSLDKICMQLVKEASASLICH